MSDDLGFMRRALALAREGWGQTAPNPMVGAVVVRDGQVVGEGAHRRYGDAHAEPQALAAAGDAARGATLYVTLEPCGHHGRTPPCSEAVIRAGIARVVVATRDDNPVARGGAERIRAAGIAVEVGIGERESRELNAAFFHAVRSDRPFVTLKLALSIDGAITDADRRRGWLTGPAARREVHHLRAGHDAIAVGIGTVLADDPLLTVRDVVMPRVPPTRIVFDSSLRIPASAALLATAREIRTVLVHREGADADGVREAGAETVAADSTDEALRALRQLGIRSILVEGGARLAGAFLTEGLVDRLVIFQAPVILGAGALNAFAFAPAGTVDELRRLPIVERRPIEDDMMTVYAVAAGGVHRPG